MTGDPPRESWFSRWVVVPIVGVAMVVFLCTVVLAPFLATGVLLARLWTGAFRWDATVWFCGAGLLWGLLKWLPLGDRGGRRRAVGRTIAGWVFLGLAFPAFVDVVGGPMKWTSVISWMAPSLIVGWYEATRDRGRPGAAPPPPAADPRG